MRACLLVLAATAVLTIGCTSPQKESPPAMQEANRDAFTQGDVVKLASAVNDLEAGFYAIRSIADHQVVLSRCWTSDSIPRGQAATVYSSGLAVADQRLVVSDSLLSRFEKTGQHLSVLM